MQQEKNIRKIDVKVLANFILKNYGPMSHLKLQKLIYYCEAYHLAYIEQPLTDENYEAWVHGPVSRTVYSELKGESILYSDISFDPTGKSDPSVEILRVLNSSQIELIDEVLVNLSKWKDLELEAATHKEKPWIEARIGYGAADICTKIISKTTMKDYYKAEING